MDTSEDLENLKRLVSESTCPSSSLYIMFTPPFPELGEERSALNIPNMINHTQKMAILLYNRFHNKLDY